MDKIEISIMKNTSQNFTWFFQDAEKAANFMLARRLSWYKLFVNGREYSWLNVWWDASTGWDDIKRIEEHIENCIEIDEAFYGSD